VKASLRLADKSDVAFFKTASTHQSIVENTYLPVFEDDSDIELWISDHENIFVILDGDLPCGSITIHGQVNTGGADVLLPLGSREVEVWLLPTARGKGLAQEAHHMMLQLIPRVEALVAIVWTENQPSIRLFQGLGYNHFSNIHWKGPDGEGECWLGVLHPPSH
jgi:RimJ/RimL family protein N-acetyltransferase